MTEVKWPNKTPMKIGERSQVITFKLGKLQIAEIYYCLSYGVSYIPKLRQYCNESTWLSYMDRETEKPNFKTIDQAIEKLKEMVGEENFKCLTRHDGKVSDDIEEKEVSPAVWGSIDP
jgi:hypothetical protein